MSTARAYRHNVNPGQQRQTNVSHKLFEKQRQAQKQEYSSAAFIKVFMVIATVVLMLQMGRGICLNMEKCMTLDSKIHSLKAEKAVAEDINKSLTKQYRCYTSPQGVEALARDYLNLVGEHEISVVIKKTPQNS